MFVVMRAGLRRTGPAQFVVEHAVTARTAIHCHRVAEPPPQMCPIAAQKVRSAGHAIATAIHRRIQQCPCAASPPPIPQAGSLAAPSRHKRRKRCAPTAAAATVGLLQVHLAVLLLLLLHRRQHDAADVILSQSCFSRAAAGQRGAIRLLGLVLIGWSFLRKKLPSHLSRSRVRILKSVQLVLDSDSSPESVILLHNWDLFLPLCSKSIGCLET